ncbi:hypothetical protein DL768_002940 [Monosporascus sp. mg162]|nr:hypothetical protein DL768_002940 [Monosporascus sp. mg162]
MRLIDALTLKIRNFNSEIPDYAILSHTWGREDEEVTLQDLLASPKPSQARGFAKIRATCQRALQDGIHFAWVDTCCIDKTSSAELSEAINSMYEWYERSKVCYAFLEDLDPEGQIDASVNSAFKDCQWFRRGWTLQELIAPKKVEFFDKNWVFRGSREDLGPVISRATFIPVEILSGQQHVFETSAAQRMTWASLRRTTRKEDEAYCLLGLFGIHMPLLYGEGYSAFRRLQVEIVKSTGDLTILA